MLIFSARSRRQVATCVQLLLTSALLLAMLPLSAVTLEQIISHEHPDFQILRARMTVGRDGNVYIGNGGGSGYLLRLKRDGSEKTGAPINYATSAFAVNADGILANSAGHFTHAVLFYNNKLVQFASNADFLVSDAVGWDAPIWLEVGASGDFFAVDQHRNRMVRLDAAGKLVTTYPLRPDGEAKWSYAEQFRVNDTLRTFTWLVSGQLRQIGFDGKALWTQPSGIAGNNWEGFNGSFDVDDTGVIYLLPRDSNEVKKLSPAGVAAGTLTLQIGDITPGKYPVHDLRVFGNEIFIKRRHPTELFQSFDLTTGARKATVHIDYEHLTVNYAAERWTAGTQVPFTIDFTANGKAASPQWRVWARPYAGIGYRELQVQNGALQVPADFAGLYLMKVTPEAAPWQRGEASEYLVHSLVEVLQPGTRGVASVLPTSGRLSFARGEQVPLTVYLQTRAIYTRVTVRVHSGAQLISEGVCPVEPGERQAKIALSAQFTRALRPGAYTLSVQAEGLTSMPQEIYFGAGLGDNPFKLVQYGDYRETYPTLSEAWNAPEKIAAHVERSQRLGFNLFVDRIGYPLQLSALQWTGAAHAELQQLVKRLEADPEGVTPEVARPLSPLLQTLSAYSARGMTQMSILMGNDAGLPLGTGFDNRKPEQLLVDIGKVTAALEPIPAFRGWSWSSNWWVFNKNGLLAEQRAAYDAALKLAQETGQWSDILEEGSDRWLMLSYDAQEMFNKELRKIAPRLLTASAAPYRNVNVHPPIGLSNVDEVDLQIQWEQMAPPYHAPHNVDYYTRPGKHAWGHPEIWNDSGTGDQILPTLFAMVMRGAGGVGLSGHIPNWGAQPEDPRLAFHGTSSIYRTLNATLKQYGPWLTTLQGNDRVAIVISGRMARIDEWPNVWGRYFARTLEAYVACLHAHHPASVIFSEDIRPNTLAPYKAVLVVGQRVTLEPGLQSALRAVKAAGSTVFYDETCREELVREFTPLGVGFNRFESDPHAAGDDAAYWRFLEYTRATLPVVKKALDGVTAPAALVQNPEVFISERVSGDGRFLFVVNNTTPLLEPGQMWRAALCVASRMPVVEAIQLPAGQQVVYDLFALKAVAAPGRVLEADLRTVPMRVYAILPKAIARVEAKAPRTVANGDTLNYQVSVVDNAGVALRATIPLRIRLLDEKGTVLEERFDAAIAPELRGSFAVPWNLTSAALTLEVSELCSGQSAQVRIPLTQAQPPALSADVPVRPAAALAAASAPAPAVDLVPVAELYGPHVRDIAVIDNGNVAVLNAMNWDHNLYGLDLSNGNVRWRQRAGHHFSYAPQSLNSGFAVQAFDMQSAEGYHLYLGNAQGQFARRFALYGISRRTPQRFVPGLLNDRLNNFAVPASGAWVAASGDLGLAVWSRDGTLLWTEDSWKTNRNQARWEGMGGWWSARLVAPALAAQNDQLLIVSDGLTVTAYEARTKAVRWSMPLATGGEVRAILPWREGKGCAILSTVQGGRLFFVEEGKIIDTITTAADAVVLSPDGNHAVATVKNMLQFYVVGKGLRWNFQGDDILRSPRISPDGKRIVVGSELGTLYVLDDQGAPLYQHDEGTLPVAAWLPGGDLLVATWMGTVKRLDQTYAARWKTHLTPETPLRQDQLLSGDNTPTAQVSGWGNSTPTMPVEPGVLVERQMIVNFMMNGRAGAFDADTAALFDGKYDAPAKPWIKWGDIAWLGEGSAFNWVQIDTFRTTLRVSGITLVEDETHPESWVRDAYFEYWDAAQERWIFVQPLLSNAAVHYHQFAQPVESARFRIVLQPGLVGNLRLAEIVFHGEELGGSHPDVQAKHPVAVLFDEQMEDMKSLQYGDNGFSFIFENAFVGDKAMQIAGGKRADPLWRPPFGHVVPNWDFEIAENPQPGQYRYLQFAWKAASPQTTGLALSLQGAWVVSGETPASIPGHQLKKQHSPVPPTEWQLVRVDLWQLFDGKPPRIYAIGLAAQGGAAQFDRILLGRTLEDFPPK